MRLLDLTLSTPEENLAVDEAILEEAEANPGTEELLRLWEIPTHSVILGRSSDAVREVQLANAKRDGIPVLRRASGGASVVIGPGCLLYSLLLSYELRPHLRSLDQAHAIVMGKVMEALSTLHPDIRMDGTCDLTWAGRKMSGNALRCKRSYLLYHGTILYDFDLGAISQYLLDPPRKPDYRRDRDHDSFVCNLPLEVQSIRNRLALVWNADRPATAPSAARIEQLLNDRYRNSAWHRIEGRQ